MSQNGPVIGAGLPPAPYTGYTPAPGVIPPAEAPQVQTHWCQPTNKCVVTASQPVIPVPVTQEIHKKERIIEVDQTVVTDKVVPKLYHQEVFYEVPKLAVDMKETRVNVPKLEIVEEPREINVAVGFNFKLLPIWDLREVPRIFPKYGGKQEVIEVGIPQVQIVDRKVENEVPIYVGEKTVEKEVVEEQGVEVIQYKYVRKEEEVPVYKYRPVFDVDVSIPPPVIVPIPVAPVGMPRSYFRLILPFFRKKKLSKPNTFPTPNTDKKCWLNNVAVVGVLSVLGQAVPGAAKARPPKTSARLLQYLLLSPPNSKEVLLPSLRVEERTNRINNYFIPLLTNCNVRKPSSVYETKYSKQPETHSPVACMQSSPTPCIR
eukprot:Gregarina_sp_Poly_1__1084@NODE_1265_length_4568_cov_50_983337_g860_i0_p2_GENE_NODE_1265_length_4568_cov_50_983337_g860_i0NODE_1265_length_4568_cov_50_983337_g860_i0_p2_ORF_typecomplete_len374_score51_20IMCp/PF12314_8/0_00062IMCp/PF12314_8/2_4e05IMCp/PF12314_8/3_3IMCp/PF12314_8/3_6IMCp/PF12314_8/6_3e03_NODE_1265_length_4568_cov_50_983337_g860_i028353956